jgi:hypothetical protein
MGKQDEKEYCLGCGREVEVGVMTCFDCIQSVAPDFADKIIKANQFFIEQIRAWSLKDTVSTRN